MIIAIGSDHAGFTRKHEILEHLQSQGHEVNDLGTYSKDSMDYPDVAVEVAKQVASKEVERGILVCGSGIGVIQKQHYQWLTSFCQHPLKVEDINKG
jgi:ribose 5-phosphate isomerase B